MEFQRKHITESELQENNVELFIVTNIQEQPGIERKKLNTKQVKKCGSFMRRDRRNSKPRPK